MHSAQRCLLHSCFTVVCLCCCSFGSRTEWKNIHKMQMKSRAWNRKKRQTATTLLLFRPSFWLPWWHVVLFKKLLMCKYFFKIHEKKNVMCTCSFSALFNFPRHAERRFHFAFLFCLLLERGRFPFFSHHTAAHGDGKMSKKWQENKRSHRNSALKGKEKYVTHSSYHIITQRIRGIANHSCGNNSSAQPSSSLAVTTWQHH